MSFLFGKKKKSLRERTREYKRMIDRSIRDIDRERVSLQNEEKKLIADIKKMAKAGQTNAAKIMAKDLVRNRKYVEKFYKMKTQLQAVSMKVTTMSSDAAMNEAMKGVTKTMTKMNRQMNIPQMQKIMMQFEQESEKMDMKQEMMDDAMDDAMGSDDEEEESEEILAKVMAELNIDLNQELNAPSIATPASPQQSAADADLEARLENLKR